MSRSVRADKVLLRGFSLLEVLIAAFVLCAAAVTLIPSYLASSQVIDHGRNYEQATQLVSAQLEAYRGGGYAALPLGTSDQQTSRAISYLGSLPNARGSVQFTRVDSNLKPTIADTGRVLVEATVTWGSRKSDAGSVTLTTLVTSEE